MPSISLAQFDTRGVQGFQANPGMSPGAAGIPGNQMEQLGKSMIAAGDAGVRIATDMQDHINQVKNMDAANRAHGVVQDLLYNKDSGVLALRGNAAFEPDEEGATPQQRYQKKLQDAFGEISKGLGNDAQRERFTKDTLALSASFNQSLATHALNEFYSFSKSTADGQIKVETDNAALNWDNPVAVDTSLVKAQTAVAQVGKLTGQAPLEIEAKLRAASSTVYSKVIQAALENNNLTYAAATLRSAVERKAMTGDDILQLNKLMHHQTNLQLVDVGIQLTTQKYLQDFQPTPTTQIVDVVLSLESKGKDYQADGTTPLTSPKGALYAMQVMPATAAKPGYGIKPAASQTADEYNRVGRELIGALVAKRGNLPEALAAYNAGEGRLDEAVAAARKAGDAQNWLAYMPKETQAYVQDGVNKFNVGGVSKPPPTVFEFVQDAVERLGPNANPQQVKMMRDGAEHQYNLITKSLKQRGEQATLAAFRSLGESGGNLTKLPPSLLSDVVQYAPGNLDNVLRFAKAVGDPPAKSDMSLYLHLATYPQEMAKMPDSQFLQLKTKLSEEDFKHFAKERADYQSGKKTDSSDAINTPALTQAFNNRLLSMGQNPTPKQTDLSAREKIGTQMKWLRDNVYEQQNQLGRKMTPEEIEKFVDQSFLKSVSFRSTFLGVDVGAGRSNMLTMKPGDIPADSRDQLKAAFAQKGIKEPTDDQLLRAYWTWKDKNGRTVNQ